eukprot:TRINITY_DN11953_c0_g1_i1.p1 TRINITY_DN11953_c0_g1~~TRINITY_DN11953_c0_g1_i1.p1  ORF type:complete len:510 (+),score=167.22 TRINITY_DN11953_c0_g1_i1:891-2420(+)
MAGVPQPIPTLPWLPPGLDPVREVAKDAVAADVAGEFPRAVAAYVQAADMLFDVLAVTRTSPGNPGARAADEALRLVLDAYIVRSGVLAAKVAAASDSDSDDELLPRTHTWAAASRLTFQKAAKLVRLGLRLGLRVGDGGDAEQLRSGVDVDSDRITGQSFLTVAAVPPSVAAALGPLFSQGRQPHILWAADVSHRQAGSFGRVSTRTGRLAVLTPSAFYVGRKERLDRCVDLSDVSAMLCEKEPGWAALLVPRHYDLQFKPAGDAEASLQRLWELLSVLVPHHKRQSDAPPSRRTVKSLNDGEVRLRPPQGYVAPRILDITVGKRQRKIEVTVDSGDRLIVQDRFSSDPYVVVSYAGESRKTHVKRSTLSPQWKETFTFPLLSREDEISFYCYDFDVGQGSGEGDFMGFVSCSPFDPPKGPLTLSVRTDTAGQALPEDVQLLEKHGRENFGTISVSVAVHGDLSTPLTSKPALPEAVRPAAQQIPVGGARRAAGRAVGHRSGTMIKPP